jgi:hypothetical protein
MPLCSAWPGGVPDDLKWRHFFINGQDFRQRTCGFRDWTPVGMTLPSMYFDAGVDRDTVAHFPTSDNWDFSELPRVTLYWGTHLTYTGAGNVKWDLDGKCVKDGDALAIAANWTTTTTDGCVGQHIMHIPEELTLQLQGSYDAWNCQFIYFTIRRNGTAAADTYADQVVLPMVRVRYKVL